MYLDAFLEAFSVSDVTILFLLSLGVGLMPKLGGAIGLDDPVGVWCALGLKLCMLDWNDTDGWGGANGVAELGWAWACPVGWLLLGSFLHLMVYKQEIHIYWHVICKNSHIYLTYMVECYLFGCCGSICGAWYGRVSSNLTLTTSFIVSYLTTAPTLFGDTNSPTC